MRIKRLLVTAGLAGVMLGGATAWAASQGPPPRPPWVNEGGVVDLSRLPARIPLLDENGKVVGQVDPRTYYNDVADGVIEGDAANGG